MHGANRLASNSLLEALVFGGRVAEDLAAAPLPRRRPARLPALPALPAHSLAADTTAELVRAVRTLMWEKVGVVRDGRGLTAAVAELDRLAELHPDASGEARNLLCAGRLVAAAALARRESRGGHFRSDFREADPAWRRHLHLSVDRDQGIELAASLHTSPLPPAAALAVAGR